MRITVLAVPDCPNAPVAVGRITAALAGRPASVELVEVTGQAEATRLRMTGSPTILLDGVDPFAGAGAVPSVSCRIYRGSDGAAAGAPSVQDLTAALSAAGLPMSSASPRRGNRTADLRRPASRRRTGPGRSAARASARFPHGWRGPACIGSGGNPAPVRPEGSTLSRGRARSSHAGSHQLARPSMCITDGTRTVRAM